MLLHLISSAVAFILLPLLTSTTTPPSLTFCYALTTSTTTKTYNYFAFGSNMAISTMTKLRNINPISSMAAILPNHTLRFNIPGIPYIEPSYASVEPSSLRLLLDEEGLGGGGRVVVNNYHDNINEEITNAVVVHGVLYVLTPQDFATICQTEGVPFIYSLHRCCVVPYVGNGKTAGMDTLLQIMTTNNNNATAAESSSSAASGVVSAFTLRATSNKYRQVGYNNDIPPSQSYMNVLLRGAYEYQLDEKYYQKLKDIVTNKKIFGNGISEIMLQIAEKRALQKL